MGFAEGLAYSVLGVLISLFFLIGVLAQAYGGFYFGVLLVAVAILLQAGREGWTISRLYSRKKGERGKEGRDWEVRAGIAALSGLAGFVLIWLFRGAFGGVWIVFLVNDAVVTLAFLVPSMIKAAVCRFE